MTYISSVPLENHTGSHLWSTATARGEQKQKAHTCVFLHCLQTLYQISLPALVNIHEFHRSKLKPFANARECHWRTLAVLAKYVSTLNWSTVTRLGTRSVIESRFRQTLDPCCLPNFRVTNLISINRAKQGRENLSPPSSPSGRYLSVCPLDPKPGDGCINHYSP